MENILINVTSPIIKKKHICFYPYYDTTKRKYLLCEVSECFYEHPDSDGMALISKIETHLVKTVVSNDQSALKLLKYAQDNIYNIIDDKRE